LKYIKKQLIQSLWILGFLGLQGLYARTLTLKTAIDKTLAHHPDVKTFMLRIQQAEQGYNAAYADYLPQLDLSATYNPTQTYVMPQNGTFHTIDDDGWNAGREAIRVRRKDLEAKQAFYEQSKALVRQGLKTHADASRFLSAVYAAEDNLAIAKASFEKAKTSLSLYMGVPLRSDVSLPKRLPGKHMYLDKKQIEEEVITHNYRVKMDSLGVEKNKRLHHSARSAHFGSVDLVAAHNRFSTLNSYNTDYVGISYNVPLYHGGRLSAQEQQAKIGYQIAQEQKASEVLALKEELRGLLIDIDRYSRTIKAKKAQLTSAQKNLKLLSARYREGLATYIEVLDGTSQVLAAELGVLEAYYARSLALGRIEYLKGNI